MKNKYIILFTLFAFACFATSCSDDDEEVKMKNEMIKKTVSPIIVGEKVEFAYAMGCLEGKLKSAKVEASIPGATGTGFEPNSWYTTSGGINTAVLVAHECYTNGGLSSAILIDTVAATLRYFYVVPESARGQKVSFAFSSENSLNARATFDTPAYQVSMMDMKKSITMVASATGARYFSIEDMTAYTLAEVEAGNLSSKIDFIYCYAPKKNGGTGIFDYKHAFVSPATASTYFPDGFSIPATWTKNSTPMDKRMYVWDGQLRTDVVTNIFVDDIDLQSKVFTDAPNFVLDIRGEGSVYLKTANGKYVAYIYINKLTDPTTTPATPDGNATIGIKRLKIQ